jgi:hypothetical protein
MAGSNRRDSDAEWKNRLLDSSAHKRCRENKAGVSECQYWDSAFHSAENPELDRQRKIDIANYRLWIEHFVKEADGHVRSSLATFNDAGFCMPCLGRVLYDFLRGEYALLHLDKGKGKEASKRRQTICATQCNSLFADVIQACGKPHYKQIALMLNHGTRIEVPFEGGVLGTMNFRDIKTEFTPRMLRYRASVGSMSAGFGELYDAHRDKYQLLECQGVRFTDTRNGS